MCYKLCAILSEYYQERENNGPSVCVIDCGRILFLQRFVQIVCILLCNAYKTEVRNKHGDGNENGKKAIGLDKRKKQQLCTCITLFGTFLCRQVSASFGGV